MSKMISIYKLHKTRIWWLLGFSAVSFSCLPYLLLGENAWVLSHDQLDGELLCYIYQAKHLFDITSIIPEMMNGIAKGGMMPPAPLAVLLYAILSPFKAYVLNQYMVVIVGYIGMFLLMQKLQPDVRVSWLVSCLFAYLPFRSVYGLCIFGQPLLWYALWQLYNNHRKWHYYVVILFFSLMSSFALIGYALSGIVIVIDLILLFQRKWKGKRNFLFGSLCLIIPYILLNAGMFLSIVGLGGSFVTHKEELVVNANGFVSSFTNIILHGYEHAMDYHEVIFVAVTFLLIITLIRYLIARKKQRAAISNAFKPFYKLLFALYGINVCISLFYATFHCQLVVDWRNQVGGFIKYFQIDRIYWLMPTLWYVMFGIFLYLVLNEWIILPIRIRYSIAFILSVFVCCHLFSYTFINIHLRQLLFPNTYQVMSWNDYYAQDVFDEIKDYLNIEDTSKVKTASLGIYPAVALYNGFSCIDGYSNNYSLEYKHAFREIIASELARDETLRVYFDDWGNRCYLMSHDSGVYFMLEKNTGFEYHDVLLNTNAMKQLGASYLFSAAPIDNAREIGLNLVRDTPFETENSYYAIWVYQVSGNE